MKYSPKDIQPTSEPRFVFETFFGSTLGKCEYETIAAYFVSEGQKYRKWIAIPQERFPKRVKENLEGMLKKGYLINTNEGFILSELAIEVIAKKYPSSR